MLADQHFPHIKLRDSCPDSAKVARQLGFTPQEWSS
jgi:hypothetical protein